MWLAACQKHGWHRRALLLDLWQVLRVHRTKVVSNVNKGASYSMSSNNTSIRKNGLAHLHYKEWGQMR